MQNLLTTLARSVHATVAPETPCHLLWRPTGSGNISPRTVVLAHVGYVINEYLYAFGYKYHKVNLSNFHTKDDPCVLSLETAVEGSTLLPDPHPRNVNTPIPRGWKPTTQTIKVGAEILVRDPWSPGGWSRIVLPLEFEDSRHGIETLIRSKK